MNLKRKLNIVGLSQSDLDALLAIDLDILDQIEDLVRSAEHTPNENLGSTIAGDVSTLSKTVQRANLISGAMIKRAEDKPFTPLLEPRSRR